MHRRVNHVLALMVIVLMLGGAVSVVIGADGGADASRGGSRATAIDGEHLDEFDNADNLTLHGDANVLDGDLQVDRAQLRDEFERWPLAPWRVAEGMPRIVQGVLLCNGTQTSNATAEVDIDLHNIEVRFDFSPGILMSGGPRILLNAPGNGTLWVAYDHGGKKAKVGVTNSTGNYDLASSSATMATDDWYRGSIMVDGSQITVTLGPGLINANYNIPSNFTTLRLSAGAGESAAWDNVTVSKLGGQGYAVSDVVPLPEDTTWGGLTINYVKDPSTTLKLSLLDADTGDPFDGLDDITSSYLNLADRLDPLEDTAVQLRVDMVSVGIRTPKVTSWKITWVGDPPKFVKPIPKVTLKEDEPKEGVLDLREYFQDRFTDDDNLTFRVSWSSEPMHVRPLVDGHMLGFDLDTRNWYGIEYYKISCSDGYLEVESVQAEVTVLPVDDPPIVRPFGRVDMYEDEPFTIDLGPFLEDEDTQVRYLKIRALSSHATVVGHNVTLNYDKGGQDRIELEVSDASNAVQVFMDVTVREVDDPPVFKPLPELTLYEDQEETLDLSKYLSDEDDAIGDLMLDIENGDDYISIDGYILRVFYGDTGGIFEYTILASDENTTVSQVLEVSVTEINDPPVIVSVGEYIPESGEIHLSMVENTSMELSLTVQDEESWQFYYTLVTDFEGATMSGKTLILNAPVGELKTHVMSISVSDGGAATLVKIYLEVLNRNDPPQDVAISAPGDGKSFTAGEVVTFTGYAFDPDAPFGEVLTYSWQSSLDGDMGVGKSITNSTLSIGTHTITLTVSDGEVEVTASITTIIKKKDGGGGGGGGGDDGGGGGAAGGVSLALIGGIIAVVVVLVIVFAVVGKRRQVEYIPQKTPPATTPEEPIASAAAAYDKPKRRPPPGAKKAREAGWEPEEKEGTEGEEPEGPEYAVAPAPEPEPEPEPFAKGLEAVSYDTSSLYETDPEKIRLDKLKREYQTVISSLPWGVPAKELSHMDWIEVAAALAEGEKKTLDDGREVTRIGDNWYYSDTDNLKSFLRRHE